ncbi:MAG: hypothetical protein K8R21_05125 [Leptospira sp.]|nr:hypothetical protein [Leptospira sp.]
MKIRNSLKNTIIFIFFIFLIHCDNTPLATGSKNSNLRILFFQIQDITSSSATVSWVCSSPSDGILSYGATGLETSLFSPYRSSTHIMTIRNLNPGTQYAYTAFCKDILVATTLPQSFKTIAGPPDAIKQRGIWILGGLTTNNAVVSQVDLFDPVTNSWYSSVTSIPTPRSFAGIISFNGKIYVLGGLSGGTNITNLVEEYNPATNTWRTMSSMPVAIHSFVSDSISDSIYVFNGAITNNTIAIQSSNTTIYKFMPDYPAGSSGSWSTLTVVPSIATAADRAGCDLDGIIYHADGRSSAGAPLLLHDAYSSAGNTMTTLAESAAGTLGTRHGLAAVCFRPAAGDTIYNINNTRAVLYIGGSTAAAGNATSQPPSTVTSTNQFSHFVPATNTMTNTGSVNNLLNAVYYPASEISYDTGLLYVFGGATGTGTAPVPVSTIQTLSLSSPTTNNWSTLSVSLPVARYAGKALLINR